MSVSPLSGVTVVDLSSGIAGGYATKLLADLGASVTRFEPPGGVDLRRWSAARQGLPLGQDGLLFRFLASGQSSRGVDPETEADRAAALAAVRTADVVLWTSGSVLAEHGEFRPSTLRLAAPESVIVAITPFGLDGPWSDRAATEFTVQALSGGVAHRGAPGTEPIAIGGQHGEWVAGTFSAVAAMVGLRRRTLTGTGELIDVSMLEALVVTPHFGAIAHQSISGRPYFEARRPTYVGDIEPTADGYVGFALVNSLQHWLDFCVMIGQPGWNDDKALHNPGLRALRYAELTPHVRAWTTARTTAEIVELAAMFRVPAVPIGHGANVASMDHFAEQRFFQRSAQDDFLHPSPFVRFDGAKALEASPPAPPLGPHLVDVPVDSVLFHKPARSSSSPTTPSDTAAVEPSRPFAGIRILDLTAYWAGPVASHLFALLGAEVIHVESPTRFDGARNIIVRGAPSNQFWEWSHAFQGVNTNKDGLAVDLGTDAGRDVLGRLVDCSDVIVENYSPRVLEGWDIGAPQKMARERPDLIVMRMPAFGLDGPWRDRTGFAMTMEQVSGLAWMTGPADGPPVTLLGPCDPVGGAHASLALMAALARRERTGRGGLVEVPMVAGALNLAAEQVITYSATGVLLQRTGNRGPAAAPQNLYRTADSADEFGEARRVAISVATDRQWTALCAVLGNPVLTNRSDLRSADGRHRAHDEIDGVLGAWCAVRSADVIVALLVVAKVPVASVTRTSELADLAPLQGRGFLEYVEHPVTGRCLHTTLPIRFEHGPATWHRRAAPTVGRDNRAVLSRVAGLGAEAIDQLEREGVIGTAPPR